MIQGGVSSERWICLVGFVNSDESCTINARLQVEPVGVILIGFWFDCKNAKHQSEGKGKRGAAQLSQTSLLARAPLGIDHVSAENETPETNPSMNEWMKLKIKKERGKEERSAPSGRQVDAKWRTTKTSKRSGQGPSGNTGSTFIREQTFWAFLARGEPNKKNKWKQNAAADALPANRRAISGCVLPWAASVGRRCGIRFRSAGVGSGRRFGAVRRRRFGGAGAVEMLVLLL